MKLTTLSTLALSAAIVNARFVEKHETDQVVLNGIDVAEPEQYLIELAPGKTQWVTEEEKWELRRVSFEPSLFCIEHGFEERPQIPSQANFAERAKAIAQRVDQVEYARELREVHLLPH